MFTKNLVVFIVISVLFCSASIPAITSLSSISVKNQVIKKTSVSEKQKNIQVICQIWRYDGVEEIKQNISYSKIQLMLAYLNNLRRAVNVIKNKNNISSIEAEKADSNIDHIINELKAMAVLPVDMNNNEIKDLLTGEYGRKNMPESIKHDIRFLIPPDDKPHSTVFSLLCSIESFGSWALIFPLPLWFLIPLPVLFWAGEYGYTNVTGVIGSISYGIVGGYAFGFTGIVFSIPVLLVVGLLVIVLGYALVYLNPYYTP